MTDPENSQNSAGDAGCVLVVEDESLVAMFIEDALDDMDVRCCGTAASAEEAIALAERHRPAAALVDIGLRGSRDGIALAQELMARFRTRIIFLTGASDPQTRERAEAACPHGFLPKPCTEPQIAAIVEAALAAPPPAGREGT